MEVEEEATHNIYLKWIIPGPTYQTQTILFTVSEFGKNYVANGEYYTLI